MTTAAIWTPARRSYTGGSERTPGEHAVNYAFGSGGGRGGGGRMRRELRPEDLPAAPVSLRRVGALFIPYRLRLAWLLALIFVSAGLGVISPFLLPRVLDEAY